jgi:hypothetical protein
VGASTGSGAPGDDGTVQSDSNIALQSRQPRGHPTSKPNPERVGACPDSTDSVSAYISRLPSLPPGNLPPNPMPTAVCATHRARKRASPVSVPRWAPRAHRERRTLAAEAQNIAPAGLEASNLQRHCRYVLGNGPATPGTILLASFSGLCTYSRHCYCTAATARRYVRGANRRKQCGRPQEYTRTSTRASALVRESTANSYVSSCERNARSIATVCTMCRTARPPGGLLCDHGLWHRLHLPPRGTRVCISLGCRSAERAELQLERRRRCKRQLEHRAERRAVLGNHLPAQSRRRCGRGGPSPGADVAGGALSPGADVAAKSPVPAQMWTGGGPVGDHRRRCWWWDDEGGEQPRGHGVRACSEPNSAVGACAVARRRARSAPERRLDAV